MSFDEISTQPTPIKHQKQMKNKAELKKGVKRASKYYCRECGKWFPYKSKFKEHYMTHTEYRPYVCSNCGRKFNRKFNLKRHQYVGGCPMKEKWGYCKCGKSFLYEDKHYMTHTEYRPYVCSNCGRKFNRKFNLKRHQYVDGCPMKEKWGYCECRKFIFVWRWTLYGPGRDKTCLRGFRESENLTSHPSYRDKLEHWNFAWSMLRDGTFQKVNNIGADQSAQMRRLVCTFVVRKPPKTGFLASRPIWNTQHIDYLHSDEEEMGVFWMWEIYFVWS